MNNKPKIIKTKNGTYFYFPDWKTIVAELLKKFIENNVFYLTMNANDTFGFATADAVEMNVDDIWMALQVYEKYGQDGVTAFMSKIEGAEPLKELRTNKYKLAMKHMKDFIPHEKREIKFIRSK